MNPIGHRVLLFWFLICLSFNGVNSGLIGNPICQDDEYYDEERDVCLDDCGGLRCAVEQICSDRVDGYQGPRACKEKCYKDCDIMEFCNSKTVHCDPCSSICSDLRKCRHLCYDVYRNLPQTASYSSMEMTTMDATPADPTTTSEAAHLNDWVIAASVSIPVLVILALAGVTAAVIYRRKKSGSKPDQESAIPMLSNPPNNKNDSSIMTHDFRIVKSVRFDDEIVDALHQTLQSRLELPLTGIRKAEIGYQLVNYLQQCDDGNREIARQEMNHVLQGPVEDLNQLQAIARKHIIDTFKSESEEEILKWLKTGNAVREEGSEAVETPELLMMHGPVSARQTTAIIQDSNCKCLCLFNDTPTGLDPDLVVPNHLEELHLHQYLGHVDTLKTIPDASSLRALTVVLYFPDRVKIIQELIMQMTSLQALGFQLSQYVHEDHCKMLFTSLQKKEHIKCLTLYIDPKKAIEIDHLVNIISNVVSLQELWLSFLEKPENNLLERIATVLRQNPNINTISLMSEQAPVNVISFLNVIGEDSNINTVYTDHHTVKLPKRLAASFKGKLVRVRSGESSCFFTPLMYSRFLLTSIPLYIKKDLFTKYVSRSD